MKGWEVDIYIHHEVQKQDFRMMLDSTWEQDRHVERQWMFQRKQQEPESKQSDLVSSSVQSRNKCNDAESPTEILDYYFFFFRLKKKTSKTKATRKRS